MPIGKGNTRVALTVVFHKLNSTKMKRKITSKFSGTSAKGRQYFGLEFGATIKDGVLYQKHTEFVDEESYNLVDIGSELVIK
jgi:hypothetical protein